MMSKRNQDHMAQKVKKMERAHRQMQDVNERDHGASRLANQNSRH